MAKLGFIEWLALGRVIASGSLIRTDDGARECVRFESELARWAGVDHALAVSSGTAGLVCALQACGIGPGDEVLVPAYTWMGSAGAVLLAGAVPVLVEVDETLTIDPEDMRAKITPHTRAVMPVHMINRPCDMDSILTIARTHGLRVIEDACQAIGVRYRGQLCGTMGDVGVFSFNSYKNMTSGEGGAVLTRDPQIMERMTNAHDLGISYRGQTLGNSPVFLGANYRISELQGAILRVQLRKLPKTLRRMRRRTEIIAKALRAAGHPLTPANDPAAPLSVALTFETEEEAKAFSQRPGARRLFDNSKHVYTEWRPILDRRMAHPRVDPWAWAEIAPDRVIDDCPRTLDLLRRTCAVNLKMRAPEPVAKVLARQLAT
ncbi:MAG: DegT/DnrJ/EryC1/StrS family aminotransferase [Sulfitobacter sp.]|nr:DegT/DnrJ/EryC1/StrS family aminotransferase [Sulfitobacter sp.]